MSSAELEIPKGPTIDLGPCEICGKPVIIARWIHKMHPDITTCSRACGEALNAKQKEGEELGSPRYDKKELFAKAKEMMAKGQTPYSVAHELNIPTTTLHNWIHTPEKEEVRPDAATLKAQYDKAGIGCIARENHIGWVKAKEWAIEAGIDVSKPKKAIPYRHKPKPSEAKAADKPIRSMGCVEPYIQPLGVEVPNYEPSDNDWQAEDEEPIPYTVDNRYETTYKERIIRRMDRQEAKGQGKYKYASLADNPAEMEGRLTHLAEELVDGLYYIEWIIDKLRTA